MEYVSWLLLLVECNYIIMEREVLVVVWVVIKFRGYIEGLEVIVKFDY